MDFFVNEVIGGCFKAVNADNGLVIESIKYNSYAELEKLFDIRIGDKFVEKYGQNIAIYNFLNALKNGVEVESIMKIK